MPVMEHQKANKVVLFHTKESFHCLLVVNKGSSSKPTIDCNICLRRPWRFALCFTAKIFIGFRSPMSVFSRFPSLKVILKLWWE